MTAADFTVLPRHVAVIMDGNGRWAKKRGLSRSEGHIEGAKTFRKIGEYAGDLGIKHITFYAFLFTLGIVMGKMLGGVVGDRIGWMKTVKRASVCAFWATEAPLRRSLPR